MQSREIVIATNNGDIGGGEVMLFNIALMLEELGRKVSVLAPSQPDKVALRAKALGLNTIVLEAQSRRDWLLAIRRWRRLNKNPVMWCNGLLPAFATSLQSHRIIHFHQRPAGLLKIAAFLARLNRPLTLVPSKFMASVVRGSRVLYNWVDEVEVTKKNTLDPTQLRVGFIGRLSVDKGITTLCHALELVNARQSGFTAELVIAGEARFTSARDATIVGGALESIAPNVTTLGWVPPATLFEQIDLLVVPSNAAESFGLVIAEAMSAGVVVICSDAGALLEVAGFDFPLSFKAGDSHALANQLERVASEVARQSKPLMQLVTKEKDRWFDHFSPTAARVELGTLLKELNL